MFATYLRAFLRQETLVLCRLHIVDKVIISMHIYERSRPIPFGGAEGRQKRVSPKDPCGRVLSLDCTNKA